MSNLLQNIVADIQASSVIVLGGDNGFIKSNKHEKKGHYVDGVSGAN